MKNSKDLKEKESKKRSIIITLFLSIIIGLFIFNYTWEIEKMPAPVEISFLLEDVKVIEPKKIIQPEIEKKNPENSNAGKASSSNKNSSAKGKNNSSKYNTPTKIISQTSKIKQPITANPNSQPINKDKEETKKTNTENEAVNNLFKNRNKDGGADGKDLKGTTKGKRGDKDGIGDSQGTFGNGGRGLLSKVPGTMGDNSTPKTNTCAASGTVNFRYTVNSAGIVINVDRASGASDPCLVSLGKDWINQYVKAEKGSKSESAIYTIRFR